MTISATAHDSTTFERLRTQYPSFIYRDYAVSWEPEGLRFTYDFVVEPGICFRPTVRLNGVTQDEMGEMITHLAFYVGWPSAVSAITRVRELFGAKQG